MTARLPDGYRVRLRADLRRCDGGRLLVGGSPLHALRLTSAATALLDGDALTVISPATRMLAERLLDANAADPDHVVEPADASALTVVIPVRDRPEQLDRALEALAPLSCVVVDDASRNPSAVGAVAARRKAQLIRIEHNVGPAAARNAGLTHVTTPYVAFVDSDIQVAAATLLRLTRHFRDERVALVGPLVRSVARTEQPKWFERYDERSSSLDLGSRGCEVRPGAAVAWLPSACLVARADRLGIAFDPDLRIGEDVDLVWRLAASGAVVRYDPDETAWHDARSLLRDWLARKFLYGSGGAVLAERHGRHTAVAVLSPGLGVAAAAILLRRRWALPITVVALACADRRLHRALPVGADRRLTAQLAIQGLGWALRQEAALLLRHWAPATLLAAVADRRVRRMIASALLVDAVVAARDRLSGSPREFLTDAAARRLDDLAYGTGLWWGVLRCAGHHSAWRCLAVRRRSEAS